MKKIMITLVLLISAFCSFGQTIDTAALHLMQKSWDKLAAMKDINYRMTYIDTMIRESRFLVNTVKLDGTIKKDAYWHIKLDNGLEWLVRGDTLYTKERPDAQSFTFKTDWDRHIIGSLNIHNLLGTKRPVLTNDIVSIKFLPDTANAEFYTIQETYRVDDRSDETQSILRYSSFFIDKKTLLPLRRVQYGKRLESGKEAVDAYDFSAVISSDKSNFNMDVFFNTPPIQEKDRIGSLKPGSKAPAFSARNVRTDQIINLDSFKGKIVLLDFWYLSCMPCRTLMPILDKLQKKFGKDNVVVVGINVKDNDAKQIVKFLDERKLGYRQLYQAGQKMVPNYKLVAFPTTFVLDRKGIVKLTEVGLGDDTELKLERAIQKEL